MAVTLTDVAKAAGVSASTVSRALSRPERVDAVTRARIFEEIARLGYQPNLAARSLITGRTGNLGVIVPDLANPFFPDVVKAVQLRAQQRSFTMLLADSGEDPAAELDLVASLAPQVDGIVLCGARMSDDELIKAQHLAPIMLINRVAPGVPAVTIDNSGGTRQAVRHLRALRHRRIGFIGGPLTSRSNQQRLAGATAAAEEFGLEFVDLGSVAPSFEGGAAAADGVLLSEVSAVLAYNDVIAIGLMHRLASYGINIPDEISVIGFDDIALAAMTSPALTTVRYPRGLAGASAVDALLERIEDGKDAAQRGPSAPLPTELIVRRSTTAVHHPRDFHPQEDNRVTG